MGIFDIPPKKDAPLSEDASFFKAIWDDREHVSEVSGAELAYNFCPTMFFVFSHLHSKGACPNLRRDKRNIVLMTMREHHLWEFERHTLIHIPKWQWVFELYEKLKIDCEK